MLVLFDGWPACSASASCRGASRMAEKVRAQFEREVLPRFVKAQRWFAAKGETIRRVALVDHVEWTHDGRSSLLALVRVQTGAEGTPGDPYFLPLALAWEDRDEERMKALAPAASPRSGSRPKSASSPTPSAMSRSAARW